MHRVELLPQTAGPLRILALGAHCDDIEIGCGGTMLRLSAERPDLEVWWVVFASTPARASEARASAAEFLSGFRRSQCRVHEFRDGYLPYQGAAVKDAFEALKLEYTPDSLAGAAAGLASLRDRVRSLGAPPTDGPWQAPPALRAGANLLVAKQRKR